MIRFFLFFCVCACVRVCACARVRVRACARVRVWPTNSHALIKLALLSLDATARERHALHCRERDRRTKPEEKPKRKTKP